MKQLNAIYDLKLHLGPKRGQRWEDSALEEGW